MSWRERDYHRGSYGEGNFASVMRFLNGSVPLGTWFGIRVRVHASLFIFIALVLLFDYSRDTPLPWQDRLTSMGFLFGIVLLHEFGHCFAARAVGGFAEDILMWPLGGLAMATPPNRPWPTFVTVAGGPMVNVILCAIAAGVFWFKTGHIVSFNPFHPMPAGLHVGANSLPFYILLLFIISYYLLLFNLLPIYPLDGGQIFQTILWPWLGQYRSMSVACVTGMVGAGVLGVYGLFDMQWMLLLIAINGFVVCYQKRMLLREMGPEGLEEAVDYSASIHEHEHVRRRRLSRRVVRRAQREAAQEQAEQARIDAILEKVSAHGMHSLTWWERRVLHKATARQRQRDLELTRSQRDV